MNNIKVLIADDHPIFREGLHRVMEKEPDFEIVGEAEDGEEAVKMAKEYSADVVLIGIIMPKIDGIEATRQIKSCCPQIAVLILSAYDDDEFVFKSLKAGAAGYLIKSIHGQELVTAIRAVCQGESVLHPAIISKVMQRFAFGSDNHMLKERPEDLSERETEILKLATRGLSNQEIAVNFNLSLRTVQAHFTHITRKLQVGSRTEAILRGLKEGWLSLNDLSPAIHQ